MYNINMKFAERLVTGALLGSLGEKSVFESCTPTCCKLKKYVYKDFRKFNLAISEKNLNVALTVKFVLKVVLED